MAFSPVLSDTAASHATDEARLLADDREYLAREVDGLAPDASRRWFLGRSAKLAAGLAACAAIAQGLSGLASGATGLVSRAEGAPPVRAAAPVRRPQAPRMAACTPADRREWDLFRSRFITADGRVVDTGNNGVSHTEGQGFGMLFAVACDDPQTFERLLAWTTRTLARPSDALHAWRYVPNTPRPVADLNNATDGDLFIACALWRASFRWNRPDYATQATAIARDVLRLLVRQVGGRTVLLPAANGFEQADRVNLNPSYYCFVAMQELAEAVPSPLWAHLRDDGVAMIAEGRFGAWRLPPDWLSVNCRNGALEPASGWPARFSYDAIRVPLHLAWAGLMTPAMNAAFLKYWSGPSSRSAWVDLKSNAGASYPPSSGFLAVTRAATTAGKSALPHDFPSVQSATDYYSAALTLLARVAAQEIRLA